MEANKPNLNWLITFLYSDSLPYHKPMIIKPGIWVCISLLRESKIIPRNKPAHKPSSGPYIKDHGNSQNKGQYGWYPINENHWGLENMIKGINKKDKIEKLYFDSNCIKYPFWEFAPNL